MVPGDKRPRPLPAAMHAFPPASRRRKLLIILAFVLCTIFALYLSYQNPDVRARLNAIQQGKWPALPGGAPLPAYDRIIQLERKLPQHNLSLPYPEGKGGRYVKFSNQRRGLGWNNVLTEVLLCSHLAWRAKRAYVFQDYHWELKHYPFRVPFGVQPYTPISALIAGPTAGGNWSEGDDTPRSVSAEWFDTVCPPEDTEIIYTDVAKENIGLDGKYVMEHWLRLFNESPKRCIDVVGVASSKNQFVETFDLGTPQILTAWPDFRDSPVSKLLRTSPLVNSAIDRNEHLFFSHLAVAYTNPYVGMMAIHLRRGDYEIACHKYPRWSSPFYGWNQLSELTDAFTPPPGGGYGTNTPENTALYLKRCLPTVEQILTKIKDSKLEWEQNPVSQDHKLTSLYIMTNADRNWLNNLKNRLFEEGWLTVVSSGDLILDAEQTTVAMSVDMDIGRRAAVFIGNGWSSMTTSVVHRRLVDDTHPLSTRFW